MLIELRIRNFAVIERLAVRLEPGLNALTGETGAGKSIIVGALSLLLGERASADVVRAGADRATVEGVFDVAQRPEILARLGEHGIDAEDGLLILRREVAAEGRNRAWINGAASTAALVGELGQRLVDLHGQHEHQTLLRPDEQRAILDAYGNADKLLASVADAYTRARDAERALVELDERRRQVEQRKDFLRFQAEEIERAELESGEEADLEGDARRLQHAEELARRANELHFALYSADQSIGSQLGELRRTLEQLIRIDPDLADARESLETALVNAEELGRRMGDYAASIEHDPARLDRVLRRLDAILKLKTKYGPELDDVIATGQRARDELDVLDRAEFERRALEKEAETARAELIALAGKLTTARRKAASKLAREASAILPDLGMSGGRFDIVLQPLAEPGAHGAESIEFRVALNAGFEPRPLARVASGGELSRVMLALKTILAGLDDVPTLVFDEVDAGIGGKIAHQVGNKLRSVAHERQVFVITHLPQIASRAQHHLLVEKGEKEGSVVTQVTELDGEARIAELARLLGGDPESANSRAHARELLTSA